MIRIKEPSVTSYVQPGAASPPAGCHTQQEPRRLRTASMRRSKLQSTRPFTPCSMHQFEATPAKLRQWDAGTSGGRSQIYGRLALKEVPRRRVGSRSSRQQKRAPFLRFPFLYQLCLEASRSGSCHAVEFGRAKDVDGLGRQAASGACTFSSQRALLSSSIFSRCSTDQRANPTSSHRQATRLRSLEQTILKKSYVRPFYTAFLYGFKRNVDEFIRPKQIIASFVVVLLSYCCRCDCRSVSRISPAPRE